MGKLQEVDCIFEIDKLIGRGDAWVSGIENAEIKETRKIGFLKVFDLDG